MSDCSDSDNKKEFETKKDTAPPCDEVLGDVYTVDGNEVSVDPLNNV